MGKFVAVEGCVLTLSSGNATSIQIVTPASKNTIEKKGIYYGTLNISISGFSSTNVPNWIPMSGSGSGTLSPTSQHVSVNGKMVVRADDESATITINGQISTESGNKPAIDMVTVKITDAGQTKIKAA